MSDALHVYDTTLRDGAQQEGLSLSVADKLTIARHLDELGRGLHRGRLAGRRAEGHRVLRPGPRRARPQAGHADRLRQHPPPRRATPPTTRRSPRCASRAPRWSAWWPRATSDTSSGRCAPPSQENLAMVRDTVAHLRAEGQRVFVDLEHFFDGYADDRAYALEVVRAAAEAGAEVVVLCDTNGGMLPPQVSAAVADVLDGTGARLGIHCHNDTGCAVANTLAAVDAGASHVQGTVNGYGERTGNADLLTVVANLELKQRPPGAAARRRSADATRLAHAIAEVTNVPPSSRQPYVGLSGLRAQGRPARQRDQGRPRPLPAHRPDAGRQRHAAAGLGDGRPGQHRAQGQGARLRPDRRPRPGDAGRRAGSSRWSSAATPSRRPTRRSS